MGVRVKASKVRCRVGVYATHYQAHETTGWEPYPLNENPPWLGGPGRVHAIRFSNGVVWDTVNGFRRELYYMDLPGVDGDGI